MNFHLVFDVTWQYLMPVLALKMISGKKSSCEQEPIKLSHIRKSASLITSPIDGLSSIRLGCFVVGSTMN